MAPPDLIRPLQMRSRGTLLLLSFAAALGLYVWLVELRGSAERMQAETSERRVVDVQADAIVALELPLSDGGHVRLVRDGGWRLESPLEFPADEAAVERALKAIEELEADLTIEPAPEDLAPFGLSAEARTVVSARTAERTLRLYLGADAPVGSGRYFALGDDDSRIYTGYGLGLEPLSTTLLGIRDKRLTLWTDQEVKELQVRVAGSLIVTALREADEWRLVAPSEEPADSRQIGRLLQDLVFSRASEFVDDPRDLSTFGLEFPELQISLARADGETQSFEVARAGGTAYVRVDSAPVLYAVPERLLDDVPRTFFDYRAKRVFDLEESAIKRVELRFPRTESVHRFERRENEWVPEAGSSTPKPFAIQDLLFVILGLDAIGIEPTDASPADFALDPASIRISCIGGEGEELGWLELGDQVDEVLSARSSQSDRIWRVAADLGEDVPLGLEAFQARFVAAAGEQGA